MQKLPLAILALLMGVAALLSSSDAALVRYKTILRSTDTDYSNDIEESAVLSSRSRKQLFWDSVDLTLAHPITGVGPGMFQVADAKTAEEAKHPAAWHETHNTFTQISSEEGIPALLIYLTALYFCFQSARSARKFAVLHPELRFLREMAFCLRLSVVAFAVTAIFASNAYYFYFPIVAGLCAALERSMKTDLQRYQAAVAPPAPVSPWAVPARQKRIEGRPAPAGSL